MHDVLRASGAHGDALEAMVREAVRESERAIARDDGEATSTAAPADDDADAVARTKRANDPSGTADAKRTSRDVSSAPSPSVPSDDTGGGREVEIDPRRWAERADEPAARRPSGSDPTETASFARGRDDASADDANDAEDANEPAARTSPSPPISEPSAADPSPESSRRAARDAAASGPPPARAGETEPNLGALGREAVEPQIVTRRVLRELAMRRGVSYADLLAKAEAEGVDLPEE